MLAVAVLRRQVDEGGRLSGIYLRVEVGSLDIHQADLRAVRRVRVENRPMLARGGHGHADHGPQRLERRRWSEEALPRVVASFELPCNKAGPVLRVDVVPFVDIYPSDADGWASAPSPRVLLRDLQPDPFRVEVGQLCGARLVYELVLQDLSSEVVLALATVALLRAAKVALDLGFVVTRLNSEAAVLQNAVLAQLVADASQDRLTQLSRVLRCLRRVAAAEDEVLASRWP